jgi:hypothetical protein
MKRGNKRREIQREKDYKRLIKERERNREREKKK